MKKKFLAIPFAIAVIFTSAPLRAQVNEQPKSTRPALQDTVLLVEPAISDTTASARIFLDKIEVFGTVAKPQALFILPGSDPTIEGLNIDRSFFKEIFRPVQWDDFKKAVNPAREKLQW
jgi:hypothetical protein